MVKKFIFLIGILSAIQAFSQDKLSSFEDCNSVFKSGFPLDKKIAEFEKCLNGKRFPDFNSISTKWIAYSNEDLKRKVVLVNFWFIACAPCVAEMPMLNELKNEYKGKDFFLLSFARDDKKSVEEFFKSHNVEIETISDAEKIIAEDFKWRMGFPANFILGKDGKIVFDKTGSPTDKDGIAKAKEEFKKIIDAELTKQN